MLRIHLAYRSKDSLYSVLNLETMPSLYGFLSVKSVKFIAFIVSKH